MTTKLKACLVAAAVAASFHVEAADIRLNGFISVVGGKTLSEGTRRNPLTNMETNAGFSADRVTDGNYDDELKFNADSNYGLQITSDVGHGLSVTGQITGNGGEGYDAVVSWAYIGYQLSEAAVLQLGRQRLPMFNYSDFIDVAYAYHWIRPPSTLSAAIFDTYEGVKLSYTWTPPNWDWNLSTLFGNGSEEVASVDTVELQNLFGAILKADNSWLQLRASLIKSELLFPEVDFFMNNGVRQGTDDNPLDATFYGLSANVTLGNWLVVSEYSATKYDEPFGPDLAISGFKEENGWYISAAYRHADVTTHLTYGQRIADIYETGETQTGERASTEITLGARWDFHASAAAKIEYTTVSDDSNNFYRNEIGFFGFGESEAADVLTFGVDVIF